MAILYFDNDVVGATDGHLVFFLDSIEVLESDHPRRRFVAMLAVYATEIAEGQYPGPYRTADAQDFARCMLMPAHEFLALARRCDRELAEHFAVPLDQVAIHRAETLACRGEHGPTAARGPGGL